MKKSDIRIKHSFEAYSELTSNLGRLIKYLLLELRKEVTEKKDIIFLYALARAITQMDSIIALWNLKHYSDCLILYRTQVERLLTYHHLIDTNSINEFDDWSFIQNFETRNKAKSDGEHNKFLDKSFWTESRKRIERYKRLKSENIFWKRPSSNELEEVAKKHNAEFLFKYGYKFASGHVHPLSSDGEEEFGLVTRLKHPNHSDNDTTPILNNSIVVLALIFDLALSSLSFSWNEYIHKVIDGIYTYIRDGNEEYKEHMKVVDYMISTNFKLYKKVDP